MRSSIKTFVSGILAMCMLLSLVSAAYASTDASAHLDSYRAICTAKRGSMVAVTVEVDGTGLMDDIGAVNIYVYRSTDETVINSV